MSGSNKESKRAAYHLHKNGNYYPLKVFREVRSIDTFYNRGPLARPCVSFATYNLMYSKSTRKCFSKYEILCETNHLAKNTKILIGRVWGS